MDPNRAPRAAAAGAQDAARAATLVRARVVAAGTETGYLRTGSGRPILLLAGGASDEVVAALLAALRPRGRIVAPELPGACGVPGSNGSGRPATFNSWLRAFLEGLGLGSVQVVADEQCASAVLDFAHEEPGRIERVLVLVDAGRGEGDAGSPPVVASAGAGRGAALEARLAGCGVPALLARVAVAAGAPIALPAEALSFLGE